MKKHIFTYVLLLGAFVTVFSFFKTEDQEVERHFPKPTMIKDGEGDPVKKKKKRQWLDMLHWVESGTDWKSIVYQYQFRRHLERRFDREDSAAKGQMREVFAGGKLVGQWRERGSSNQAGSVFDTEYDPRTDEIWLLSAGGTLFKGKRTGNAWEVINQDIQFTPGLLKFIPHQNSRRLLSVVNRIPHFSDDEGISWTAAIGISHKDSWGTLDGIRLTNDSLHTLVTIAKPGYWDNFTLYLSKDKGESFTSVQRLSSHEGERFHLCKPHFSNEILLINKVNDRRTRLYRVNTSSETLETLITTDSFGFGTAEANLAAIRMDTFTRLVTYRCENDTCTAFRTDDYGKTWTRLGQLEARPWGVGLFIVPSQPDLILAGEVHCQYSRDGGLTWQRVNNWWDYYGDVQGKLHADMMHFEEHTTLDGRHFLLSSNHGGLNVTYNYLLNFENLGLEGLNVSQYYSIRTDPINPYFIYGGSQDQGFQVANSFDHPETVPFEQVISGDYGHIAFSQNGNHLWTVYPGGWVSYYANPQSGDMSASWELQSEHESVWIPPLMQSPDPFKNEVFLAGGNAEGGAGSYIIQLSSRANQITATNLPFDFRSNSGGGEVSALTYSGINPKNWYAATTNGRFFYSADAGTTWDQTINFIPSGHYLYGQAIYASNRDSNTVYLAGSGYSNPAVYVSHDGGRTFEAMIDSLPPTLVFGLASDPEERMLFAATESGPFVYFFEDARWYDLSGLAAPAQTYWSVEFVPDFNLVRFGTYGRGIWDFEIQEVVRAKEPQVSDRFAINIFPNPSPGITHFEILPRITGHIEWSLTNVTGKIKMAGSEYARTGEAWRKTLDLSNFDNGVYFFRVKIGSKVYGKKLVISH